MVREISIWNAEEEEELKEIEYNLQRLTNGILDISIDDLRRHYQCHSAGVSGNFERLLRRVACVVVCYHKHKY